MSCPNVKEGCLLFGSTASGVAQVTRAVRKLCRKPLIIKLSPNVSDIAQIARAAEEEGADCVSLINTLLGMAIDIDRRKPILSNIMGGLSGPAVKPVAVRMVYQVAKAVKIPVIGMGGISNGMMPWSSAGRCLRCYDRTEALLIREFGRRLRRNQAYIKRNGLKS